MKKKRILVVAAHPDDEVLGCGGTIARLVQEGNIAYSLILGCGKDSRGTSDDFSEEKEKLKQEALTANRCIGVDRVFFADFPDNSFDSVPLLKIIKHPD